MGIKVGFCDCTLNYQNINQLIDFIVPFIHSYVQKLHMVSFGKESYCSLSGMYFLIKSDLTYLGINKRFLSGKNFVLYGAKCEKYIFSLFHLIKYNNNGRAEFELYKYVEIKMHSSNSMHDDDDDVHNIYVPQ